MMIEKNSIAPDFSLKSHDNKVINLSEFKGKWIILYFYPKDNTPGCTKEAVDFTEISEEIRKNNGIVIGISPDSIESHKKFIDKQNLNLLLLSDETKEVHKKYGTWGLKKNYGKEYEGVIRSTFLISPEFKIVEIWKNVRVRSKTKKGESKHAIKVLEKLKTYIN